MDTKAGTQRERDVKTKLEEISKQLDGVNENLSQSSCERLRTKEKVVNWKERAKGFRVKLVKNEERAQYYNL